MSKQVSRVLKDVDHEQTDSRCRLASQLSQANGEVELCDEAGKSLGYFLPPELIYSWARTEFSDQEERQKALDEVRRDGGLTTAQVLDYLRNLETK